MTVLVAYNETPQGKAAFAAAVEESERRETNLVALVLTPQPNDAPIPSQLGALISAHGKDVEVSFRSDKIDVADAILDHAERIDAEIIVLGARKRTPVGKFLLGSTTQRILLDASVPVLVIKAGE
ncbi:universal stress protein [Timonella senegalensis]|uniref:universal stress protein n=1 Tax=Timonella senegalensis TaxID=1465825 RepID=UPI0002FEC82B|nr:universal stress protein [Timonella senegalensis]